MALPVILVDIPMLKNPEWVPVRLEDGSIDMNGYYVDANIEAEILTLNLNARTMRVRFTWMGKVDVCDISMPETLSVTIGYN